MEIYDYAARQKMNEIPVFLTGDPHAENYYSWSPYAYVGNNPMKYTDPTGMDWYVFDSDSGEFRKKTEAEGQHRMAVRSENKDGSVATYTFYDFADPENDPSDIDAKKITSFTMVSEGDVENIIDTQGGFNTSNSSYYKFSSNSTGGKSFDYSQQPLYKYMSDRGISDRLNSSLYIAEGDTYAHNRYNFGNFLWGATGHGLGMKSKTLSVGGHLNSIFNPRLSNGYSPQFDSADDQLSILRGVLYSKKHNYKSKRKWDYGR